MLKLPSVSRMPLQIGVVVPMQGPGGIFGPSCIAVSEMAAAELNAVDGIDGRPVEMVYIDGGQRPSAIVAEVEDRLSRSEIDAITGWHISSVRRVLEPVVRGQIPYVYTSLFEGEERARGVYCSGETPDQQIFPAIAWLRENLGIRKWHVVGAQYVWPVESLHQIARHAGELGVEIVGTSFVQMGKGADPRLPAEVAASQCDGVLMLLVGQDAVEFNRSFTESSLAERVVRYSPLMDENMLLASGPEATVNLYCSAAYFNTLATEDALDFLGRYIDLAGGPSAPSLNNMAQSCYQGIQTLVELAQKSGAFGVDDFDRVIDGLTFTGPRGVVRYDGNQAVQAVHMARADIFTFDVIGAL